MTNLRANSAQIVDGPSRAGARAMSSAPLRPAGPLNCDTEASARARVAGGALRGGAKVAARRRAGAVVLRPTGSVEAAVCAACCLRRSRGAAIGGGVCRRWRVAVAAIVAVVGEGAGCVSLHQFGLW